MLCCWLPWNHTAGGNHNFGIALYNGGTLYIDEGKPTPQHFATTLRNLREVSAVAHFTVPRTYEMLLPHLRRDPVLRETFYRNLKIYFYAAAGLGQQLLGRAARPRRRSLRRGTGLHHRVRRHGNGAVRHLHGADGCQGRLGRAAGARARVQADAGRGPSARRA